MKLLRHQDVGLMIAAELAVSSGNSPVSLSAIAGRHGMSVFYLKNIARALREHGLIRSREGFGGGYLLSRPPARISIWDVIVAVDTGVTLREYENRVADACPLNKTCLPRTIRHKIAGTLRSALEGITISQLIGEKGGQ